MRNLLTLLLVVTLPLCGMAQSGRQTVSGTPGTTTKLSTVTNTGAPVTTYQFGTVTVDFTGTTVTGFSALQFEINGSVTGGVGTASGLFGGASSDTALYAATGNNIDFYYGATPTLVGQFTSTGLNALSVNGIINVVAYGADPTNTSSSTAAIQNAINAATAGQMVYIPAGIYRLTGSGAQLLNITKNVNLKGAGMGQSILAVDSSVGATTDVIHLNVPGVIRGNVLEDFGIAPESGTPGRYAINLDISSAGQGIANSQINRVQVQALGSSAIFLTQGGGSNTYFDNVISLCYLNGGTAAACNFTNISDNNQIVRCIIDGSGPGIVMSTLSGAEDNIIERNNFVCTGDAIDLSGNSDRIHIIYNEFEQLNPYNGSHNAVIWLGGTGSNNNVVGNTINPQVTAGAKPGYAISVAGTTNGAVIRDNFMLPGTTGHILIAGGAIKTQVFPNFFTSDGSTETSGTITDSGTGTWGNPFFTGTASNSVGYTGNINQTGILSTTGTTQFGTASGGQIWGNVSCGTNFMDFQISNNGGTAVFGLENNSGGTMITGSPAYALDIVAGASRALMLGSNGTHAGLEIDASQNVIGQTGIFQAAGSVTGNGSPTYESYVPIYVAIKSVTLFTATTPVNLGTIVLPTGITRYFIPAASSIQCYAETAAGTLAAGTIQLRTATSGGGSQIGSTITPPASASTMTTTAGSDTTVFTGGTIYLYQTGNSANAGTVSIYIKLVPIL